MPFTQLSQAIEITTSKAMNKVGQRKVPFLVRLKKIKNEEVLFPVRLRAKLEWSLEQKCNQNEISCPILDPRSIKHEDILIPNIFFETGTILYRQFHQCRKSSASSFINCRSFFHQPSFWPWCHIWYRLWQPREL